MDQTTNQAPVNTQGLNQVLKAQTEAYLEHGIPSLEQRLANLNKLLNILKTNQSAITEAISKDFGHRPFQETLLAELYLCIDGIKYARKRLKQWMRPQKRVVSLWLLGLKTP